MKNVLILSVVFQTIIISFFALVHIICGPEIIKTIINSIDSSLFIFCLLIGPLIIAIVFAFIESIINKLFKIN